MGDKPVEVRVLSQALKKLDPPGGGPLWRAASLSTTTATNRLFLLVPVPGGVSVLYRVEARVRVGWV